MSHAILDPHHIRNNWNSVAPPSPVKLKASVLPPTDAHFTLIGWVDGDCYIFNLTTAPSVTPDATTFAQLVADQIERENGEPMTGTISVECLTILRGKAVTL
jgi:hypothetical protein